MASFVQGLLAKITKFNFRRTAFWIILGFLSLFGGWLIWYVTPYGVGIYYDSLNYAMAAHYFAIGSGIVRVSCNSIESMVHYPPLYPLFLSVFEFFGSNAITGARLLDMLCMCGTVFLTGLISQRISRNNFFSLFAALIICISSIVIKYFSWAMSEPLYLLFMLLCIFFLDYSFQKESHLFLFIAAIFASMAIMTRFIGIALITSGVITLFFHQKRTYKFFDGRFFRRAILFIFLSFFPLAIWLIRNMVLSGSVTGRSVGWYFSSPDRIISLAYIAKWFIPWNGYISWNWKFALIITALALFFFLLSITLIRNTKNSSLSHILITNIVTYLGIVIFLMAFADQLTPLDNRILLPVYILTIILIISFMAYLWGQPNLIFKYVSIFLTIYLVIFHSYQVVFVIAQLRVDGQFYASSVWRDSEVSRALIELKPKTIYTNDSTAVYFGTKQPTCSIPLRDNEKDLDRFKLSLLKNPDAVIAIYYRTMSGFVEPELFNEGLTEIKFSDGVIYTQH